MATNARLEELKKKFEENPRRYFAPLANEYRKQGDLTQAIALCRAHLPNQPGHISGHIVLAQALFEARELPESRQIFEQALELDPENLIALRTLGDIAKSQGEIIAARSWYERVLEADPRNDEIASLLREIAAAAASMPAPMEEPHQLAAFAGNASVDESAQDLAPTAAQHAEAWDPDKTPLSNAAISDVPQGLETSRRASDETDSSDIFGDGVVDQGADLLTDFQPMSEIASAYSAEPESAPQPAEEFVVSSDAPESEVSAARPEVQEVVAEDVGMIGEFTMDAEDTMVAAAPIVEAPQSSGAPEFEIAEAEQPQEFELSGDEAAAPTAEAEFEADADAFAVAQHLSDPEAHPSQYSDDWFNAPTPPRGVAAVSSASVEPEAVDTVASPPSVPVMETQGASVDFASFDLIENSHATEDSAESPLSPEPVAADDGYATTRESVEPYAGWFDEPATPTSAGAASDDITEEPTAAPPAMESIEVAEELTVAAWAPPQVDVEAEPEAEAIDRGLVGADAPTEPEQAVEAVSTSSLAEPVWGRTIEESVEPDGALPEMFVTETMAELYLQQGFTDEALQVYRKLLDRNPTDESLRSRIASLEAGASSSLPEAASAAQAVDRAGRSVRSFFGRIARRQPARRTTRSALDVESLGAQLANRQGGTDSLSDAHASPTLADLFVDAQRRDEDDDAARRLSSAFTPTESAGRPTRAADSELSLDHLFRDVQPESSSAVTLDAFFAATGGDTSEASAPSATPGEEERTGDIEQFTAWLEGLKKK